MRRCQYGNTRLLWVRMSYAPILELTKKMKKMAIGDELTLITTAIGSKDDVPVWCDRTGNELVRSQMDKNTFVFYIIKTK
jgi:tRNA 2-thiouridine synthesizing protein A